jgi:hypothetical protein
LNPRFVRKKAHQAAQEIELRLRRGGVKEKERPILKKKILALNDRVVESIQEIHLKERQIEVIGDKIRRYAELVVASEARIRACCDRVKLPERELARLFKEIKATLYELDHQPRLVGVRAGLGGRDVSRKTVLDMVRRARKRSRTSSLWIDLRKEAYDLRIKPIEGLDEILQGDELMNPGHKAWGEIFSKSWTGHGKKIIANEGSVASGGIYNIGNPDNNVSVRELATMMVDLALTYPEYRDTAGYPEASAPRTNAFLRRLYAARRALSRSGKLTLVASMPGVRVYRRLSPDVLISLMALAHGSSATTTSRWTRRPPRGSA